MKQNEIKCERCGEVLNPKKVKWLELSQTDGNYYETIPKGHISQGAFSFGTACATNELKETIANLKNSPLAKALLDIKNEGHQLLNLYANSDHYTEADMYKLFRTGVGNWIEKAESVLKQAGLTE